MSVEKGKGGFDSGGVKLERDSTVQVKYWRALHCVMNLCRIGCEYSVYSNDTLSNPSSVAGGIKSRTNSRPIQDRNRRTFSSGRWCLKNRCISSMLLFGSFVDGWK